MRALLLTLTLFSSFGAIQAQLKLDWMASTTPNTLSDNRFYDLDVLPSGEVIASGIAGPVSGWRSDFLVSKFDSTGNNLWSYTLNGTEDSTDFARAIGFDQTGSVWGAGTVFNDSAECSLTVVRLRQNGTVNWRMDTIPIYDGEVDMHVFPQGHAVIAANFELQDTFFGYSNSYIGAIWLDSLGRETYRFIDTIGGFADMAVRADGRIAITGISRDGPYPNVYTTVIDSGVGRIWSNGFSGSANNSNDVGVSVAWSPNGSLWTAGHAENPQEGIVLIGYDSAGQQIGLEFLPESGAEQLLFPQVHVSPGGFPYLLYESWLNGFNPAEQRLRKYSPSGNLLWAREYAGLTKFRLDGCQISTDQQENIYLGGRDVMPDNLYSPTLLRLDSAGNITGRIFEAGYIRARIGRVDAIKVVDANHIYCAGAFHKDTTTTEELAVVLRYSSCGVVPTPVIMGPDTVCKFSENVPYTISGLSAYDRFWVGGGSQDLTNPGQFTVDWGDGSAWPFSGAPHVNNDLGTIVAVETDSSGCRSIPAVKDVVIDICVTTGPPLISGSGITAFPNPFEEEIRIMIQAESNQMIRWEVFDLSGRSVQGPGEFPVEAGTTVKNWGANLRPGVYLFRFETLEGVSLQKVVKL